MKADLGDSEVLPQAFVVHEEESFVFLNWTAEVGAELMQGKRGDGGAVKGRAGVESIIAQRVERASMKVVSAGRGHHLDLHAAGGAALGGVDRGADAKLGNGVECDVEPRLRRLRLLLHAVV